LPSTANGGGAIDTGAAPAAGGVEALARPPLVTGGQSDAGEGAACDTRWFFDRDGDGWGDDADSLVSCLGPIGAVRRGGDCDDASAAIHPAASETCDGRDQDCDGSADEEVPDAVVWYRDGDDDGAGDPAAATASCQPVPGHSRFGVDCDDTDASVYPGAPEVYYDGVDADCDPSNEFDQDGDGVDAAVQGGTDCDDRRDTVYPGAAEQCNHRDDNCDGAVDEDGAVDGIAAFVDDDRDGFGGASTRVCTLRSGLSVVSGDCDDADPRITPLAQETWYDGVDQDCDGWSDDDADGDGLDLWTQGGQDCDDADAESGMLTWFQDVDQDGYGATETLTEVCVSPGADWGHVEGDCDDAEGAAAPDLVEVCGDGIDNDCDGGPTGCGLFQTLDSDEALGAALGSTASDLFGTTVDIVGDVNGDGIDDLAVGVPGEDSTASQVGGAVILSGDLSDGAVTLGTFTGSLASGLLGRSLSAAGDVDGDGFDDLLVGSPIYDGGGTDVGGAFLLSGPLQGTLSASGSLVGAVGGDYLSSLLDGGHDLTGDGHPDVVVGAYGADDTYVGGGAVYLFDEAWSGTASASAAAAVVRPAAAGGALGLAGGMVEDLNGDGQAELVVTGGTAAYLFAGPFTGDRSVSDADATLSGLNLSSCVSVDGGGDLDGDGQGDLVLGDGCQSSSYGAFWVISGAPSGSSTLAAAATAVGTGTSGRYLGRQVSIGGDVDQDGADDLFVSATDAAGSKIGSVYLFAGPLAGSLTVGDAVGTLGGANSSMSFGVALRAGDLDQDGSVEVVVGAPYGDDGATNGGGVYLFGGLSVL
jgi:hypothetical protein